MKRRLFLKSSLSAGMGTFLVPENALHHISIIPEEEIPVVDTHMHLWDLEKMQYPWLENQGPPLNKNFLLVDYQLATPNIPIQKMVFVESARLEEQYLKEVDWVLDQSKIEPKIQGIVAYLPLERDQDLIPKIETLLERRMVKGIRRGVNQDLMVNPNFQSGLNILSRYNLSFDLNITPEQIPQSITLIRQCPETVFILDHICNPNIKDNDLSTWKVLMVELAKMENVYIKLSGMITKANVSIWKPEDLVPYIHHVLNTFGPARMMFGSDWPVLLKAGSYQDWYRTLRQILQDLSYDEKKQVFYGTAVKVYRLS